MELDNEVRVRNSKRYRVTGDWRGYQVTITCVLDRRGDWQATTIIRIEKGRIRERQLAFMNGHDPLEVIDLARENAVRVIAELGEGAEVGY